MDLNPQSVAYLRLSGFPWPASFYKLDRSLCKGRLSHMMLVLVPLGTNKCSDFTASSPILVEFEGEGWYPKFALGFAFLSVMYVRVLIHCFNLML